MQHKFKEFGDTDFNSRIVLDYLQQNPKLSDFCDGWPQLESFSRRIAARDFTPEKRRILAAELEKQYDAVPMSKAVSDHISALRNEGVYTLTTGQQLGLMGGPQYTCFKIIHTLSLAAFLQQKFPFSRFVPVFWLQSEDHDIEEINQYYLFGKKYRSEVSSRGISGELSATAWQKIWEEINAKLKNEPHWPDLSRSYLEAIACKDWSEAWRRLLNAIFGKYGLVILDPRRAALKALFSHIICREFENNSVYNCVSDTNKKLLHLGYEPQAYVRPINFFGLYNGQRYRLEENGDHYRQIGTDISYSRTEILQKAKEEPAFFSPNVLMRPLYQESILPNLAYIGGAAEIAYWLQLKGAFDHYSLPFPAIIPRFSALFITRSQYKKMEKLGLHTDDLFHSAAEWEKQYLQRKTGEEFSLDREKKEVADILDKIKQKSAHITTGLQSSIEMEKVRLLQGIAALEAKLIKEEKRKHETTLLQLSHLKENLFPSAHWPERRDSLTDLWIAYGPLWIDELLKVNNPLHPGLHLMIEESLEK